MVQPGAPPQAEAPVPRSTKRCLRDNAAGSVSFSRTCAGIGTPSSPGFVRPEVAQPELHLRPGEWCHF